MGEQKGGKNVQPNFWSRINLASKTLVCIRFSSQHYVRSKSSSRPKSRKYYSIYNIKNFLAFASQVFHDNRAKTAAAAAANMRINENAQIARVLKTIRPWKPGASSRPTKNWCQALHPSCSHLFQAEMCVYFRQAAHCYVDPAAIVFFMLLLPL